MQNKTKKTHFEKSNVLKIDETTRRVYNITLTVNIKISMNRIGLNAFVNLDNVVKKNVMHSKTNYRKAVFVDHVCCCL